MTTRPLGARISALRSLFLTRRSSLSFQQLGVGISRRVRRLSTFERVIVANSAIIVLATVTGWWVTQHNPETYHYVIDTLFIGLTALAGVSVNFLLLRAAFAPLHSVLATIRAVESGQVEARAAATEGNADVAALAHAFNAMLDYLAQQRDDDAKRTLRAQEGERRRLALELHDQTGQSLTALALHAEAVAQSLASEEGEAARRARAQAERLCALAQQTLYEVQGIARQLRPSVLDDLGLPAALRWLAGDARQRLGVCATAETSGDTDGGEQAQRLPEEVETALFRIAQESLTNAVRHGQATHVRLRLRLRVGDVRLIVADDGSGFRVARRLAPLGEDAMAHGGQGIAGMAERARLLGGKLTIRSRPGYGCAVRVMIPLTADSDRERRRDAEPDEELSVAACCLEGEPTDAQ